MIMDITNENQEWKEESNKALKIITLRELNMGVSW